MTLVRHIVVEISQAWQWVQTNNDSAIDLWLRTIVGTVSASQRYETTSEPRICHVHVQDVTNRNLLDKDSDCF